MVRTLTPQALLDLSPSTYFLAISKGVGQTFLDHPGFAPRVCNRGDFPPLRNLLVAVTREGQIRFSSLVVYDPPLPIEGQSALLLARFWLDADIQNLTMDNRASFRCRLVTGSPQGNLPYTLILDKVEIKPPNRR